MSAAAIYTEQARTMSKDYPQRQLVSSRGSVNVRHRAGERCSPIQRVWKKARTMKIMKKIDGLASVAFLAAAVSACPVSVAGVLLSQPLAEQNFGSAPNNREPLSITFRRSTGGITQIAIERLDMPNSYLTMVTASGPTREEAAIAAASLLTFTNLHPQTSLAGNDSITFFYNQSKPTYVISELQRAKLISFVEAEAARTALDRL